MDKQKIIPRKYVIEYTIHDNPTDVPSIVREFVDGDDTIDGVMDDIFNNPTHIPDMKISILYVLPERE